MVLKMRSYVADVLIKNSEHHLNMNVYNGTTQKPRR